MTKNNNKISYNEIKNIEPEEEDLQIKNLSSYKEEWINSIKPEHNKISLYFPKWDKILRGKLRQKLVVMFGYSGTKKSILAKLISKYNADIYNNTVLYSSMEMGAVDVINRIMDMSISDCDYNASYYLERLNRDKPDFVSKQYDEFSKMYGDKLLITEKSSMDCSLYDKCLTKCKQNGNKVDILIVDGLSMMGGNGTENELYSKHSKELKDLSKKWNILILLIAHVSKGGDRMDKDLSKHVRGSEKILDNCDYYISVSQMENDDMSDEKYRNDINNFRLVLKRGKGYALDVLAWFNEKTLILSETESAPAVKI